MKQILLIVSMLILVAGAGVAQQKPPAKGAVPQPQAGATAASQVSESFVIGLEDVLFVSVWKETDHSAPQVTVRPDGKITLPLIGDIQAAGYTPRQLEKVISDRLKDYLTAPNVTVGLVRIESQKVSIVGSVSRPGSYPIGAPMTVMDLIARAGGLSEYAKGNSIKIIRKRDGKTLLFKYKEVINGKNLAQNIILENGDIVMVP
jgi:polysaccharide export outer membrane protein